MKVSDTIKLFTSQLARHLTLVFTGNVFAAGLGFLSILMISRVLSVSDFGLFNIAMSVILVVPDISTLGMDTSMMKFSSSYLSTGKTTEAAEAFKTTLFMRTVVAFFFATAIFRAAPLVSKALFGHPDMSSLIRLAASGVLFVSIFNYLKSVLYSYKMFKECVILQLLVDLVKLAAAAALIFSLKMTTFAAVGVFAFIPVVGILLGFWKIKDKVFAGRKPINGLAGRLLSYSKWTFITIICRRIFYHIGIFMLVKMVSIEATGTYGLALNLAYIFPILIISIKSVLLPEVSRFREADQFEKYLKGALKISLYICVAVIPLLFLSRRIILFFFGSRYADSVVIFNWLLLSYVPAAIGRTMRSALYSMDRPHIIALLDISSIIIMIAGCYFLIPILGGVGAGMVAFIVNMALLGVLTVYAFRSCAEYRKRTYPASEIAGAK